MRTGLRVQTKQTLQQTRVGAHQLVKHLSHREVFFGNLDVLYGVVVQWLVYIHGMDGIGVRFSATPPIFRIICCLDQAVSSRYALS